MRRRRIGTADRNGDPLDGLVNLFAVAIVLAVGFLLAALTGAGISDLLTSRNLTIVTNPGTAQMRVIVKQGGELRRLDLRGSSQVSGVGVLLGAFYKLAGGTVVYVPSRSLPPGGAAQAPGAPSTTAPSTTAPGGSASSSPGATAASSPSVASSPSTVASPPTSSPGAASPAAAASVTPGSTASSTPGP